MKFRPILSTLLILILILSVGFASKAAAAPHRHDRVWRSGEWGWKSSHHSTFINRHPWRYRDSRIGIADKPGRSYSPWSVKRREFHNSSDNFSHRFYR